MATWHFIALWPAAEDAARLGMLGEQLASGVPGARVERPERIHLTLAFIGQCSPRDVVVAAQAAADAALITGQPLQLALNAVHVFGNGRVLGVVPDGRAEGLLLHAREIATSRLRHGGVSVDARTFRPHLSLVRLPAATSVEPPIEAQRVRLDRISLMASLEREGDGPRAWRELESWSLESARR